VALVPKISPTLTPPVEELSVVVFVISALALLPLYPAVGTGI